MNKISKQDILDYGIMTVGVLILTAGVYFFKIPNGFSTGGVSGIGTLFGNIIPILSPAQWISVLNIFLLLVGFVFLGKQTGIKTIYCSLLFSVLTYLVEIIVPVKATLTDQPFLELVYAILLTGCGSAMIFHAGGSSGGTDIIALILKKFTSLNVGKALLCSDFLIATGAFFVFDLKTGLYSVLGLFAKAFLIDGIIENMNACKYFVVITDKPAEIEKYILNGLHHTATQVIASGAYTMEERTMIHTVCHRHEAVLLQREVKKIDPHAFMIITTSSEIIGRGFRSV